MQTRSSNIVYKRCGSASFTPFEPLDSNLSKKRPSQTKLDIQKMYEESLELAAHHKTLMAQNRELKEEYKRVQAIKHQRQTLISTVEKIVAEKSKQMNHSKVGSTSTPGTSFSWLVFKLNTKIYDLKSKIEAKEKAISEIMLSKEADMIRQKQTEISCLEEIVSFAREEGLVKDGIKDENQIGEIKEIVWMEQEIKEKENQIIEAEKGYQVEEKEVRRLMQELAKKKAELKTIKEMQTEYNKAQEQYKEQKRKKEQRIAGNKTYLEQLQNQKVQEQQKLESLKVKYKQMEQQEKQAIKNLQAELEKTKKQYDQRIKIKHETVIKFQEEKVQISNKKQVKRVTYEQVRVLGCNMNCEMALRGVSNAHISDYFPISETKEEYSIKQVKQILMRWPFCLEKERDALLVARYVVQDTGDGYFLEDMDTAQNANIIKSILGKLIGQVKIYDKEQIQEMRKTIGTILFKFGKLVQQSLEMKESQAVRQPGRKRSGVNNEVSKEKMIDALQNSICSLQNQTFMHEEIDFTILYLYSWSRDLAKLSVKRLFTMIEEDFKWPVFTEQN